MGQRQAEKGKNLMGAYQRNKGAAGERFVSQVLRDHGWSARRGCQHAGVSQDGTPFPDVVVTDTTWPFHIESKFVQSINITKAYDQAEQDCRNSAKHPIVFHKKNHEPLMVTLSAENFLDFLEPKPDNGKLETGTKIYEK